MVDDEEGVNMTLNHCRRILNFLFTRRGMITNKTDVYKYLNASWGSVYNNLDIMAKYKLILVKHPKGSRKTYIQITNKGIAEAFYMNNSVLIQEWENGGMKHH
jgi:Fe2+ or Zn2+ uptake regulation protein